MVLHWRRCGRVGHRRTIIRTSPVPALEAGTGLVACLGSVTLRQGESRPGMSGSTMRRGGYPVGWRVSACRRQTKEDACHFRTGPTARDVGAIATVRTAVVRVGPAVHAKAPGATLVLGSAMAIGVARDRIAGTRVGAGMADGGTGMRGIAVGRSGQTGTAIAVTYAIAVIPAMVGTARRGLASRRFRKASTLGCCSGRCGPSFGPCRRTMPRAWLSILRPQHTSWMPTTLTGP